MTSRAGVFSYEELVLRAEEKIEDIDRLFTSSSLPDEPDEHTIEAVLIHIRRVWYGQRGFAGYEQ